MFRFQSLRFISIWFCFFSLAFFGILSLRFFSSIDFRWFPCCVCVSTASRSRTLSKYIYMYKYIYIYSLCLVFSSCFPICLTYVIVKWMNHRPRFSGDFCRSAPVCSQKKNMRQCLQPNLNLSIRYIFLAEKAWISIFLSGLFIC